MDRSLPAVFSGGHGQADELPDMLFSAALDRFVVILGLLTTIHLLIVCDCVQIIRRFGNFKAGIVGPCHSTDQ